MKQKRINFEVEQMVYRTHLDPFTGMEYLMCVHRVLVYNISAMLIQLYIYIPETELTSSCSSVSDTVSLCEFCACIYIGTITGHQSSMKLSFHEPFKVSR